MPSQQQVKKNQKNSGGFADKIISFILIAGLLAGGGYFLIKNDIRSVSDLMTIVRDKTGKISSCLQSEDENVNSIDCISDSIAPSENTPSNENTENKDYSADMQTLELIPLAEEDNSNYDRSEYKHWSTIGDSCNTREFILKEQGIGVTVDNDCKALTGEWIDPYSDERITDASKSDIDHVIPLGYANSHGAAQWDSVTKEAFANDITQLLAVSATENRSKSDKGPSEYMPKNKDFHCEYASIWIQTAHKYNLTITALDRDTLQKTLEKC